MRKFVQAVAILGAGAHRTAWWAGFTVALLILFVQGVGWSGQVVVTLPFTDPPASSSDRNNRDCSDAVAAP